MSDRFDQPNDANNRGVTNGDGTTGDGSNDKAERSDEPDHSYAGERLGLPSTGRGSLAGWPPRVGALCVDWLVGNLTAYLVVRDEAIWQPPVTALDFLPLAVFAAQVWLLSALLGASMGHRLFRLGIARLDGQPVGFARGFVRTALLLLVIPVLLIDADGRGLHDRLAGTVLVRTR